MAQGKLKIKDESQETVIFTHFQVKSLTLSQASTNDSPYRIDIIGRRYGNVGGVDVYEKQERSYTNLDAISLMKQMMVDIDGYNLSQVEGKTEDAFDKSNKGDCAECFAGILEFAGRVMLQTNLFDFDGVET